MSSEKPVLNVLFLCTHNSARSILAAGCGYSAAEWCDAQVRLHDCGQVAAQMRRASDSRRISGVSRASRRDVSVMARC